MIDLIIRKYLCLTMTNWESIPSELELDIMTLMIKGDIYSPETLEKIAMMKPGRSKQSVRNSIANLINKGFLDRYGKWDVRISKRLL